MHNLALTKEHNHCMYDNATYMSACAGGNNCKMKPRKGKMKQSLPSSVYGYTQAIFNLTCWEED